MNKSRFYMGLGLGLILGAILLQLMTAAGTSGETDGLVLPDDTDSEGTRVFADISETDLKQLADRHGYRLVNKNDAVYTEEELRERMRREIEQAGRDPSAETTDTIRSSFVISRGMGSEDVAAILSSLGLIEDEREFVNWMKEHNLSRRIQIGTYVFVGKPDVAEIAEAITK